MTNKSPAFGVTVIVPCYDTAGDLLEAAVRSAFESATCERVLVQDGMSQRTDTVNALTTLALTARVEVHREPDAGQADALNKALVHVDTPFVVWLNADDLLRPGGLDVLVDAADYRDDAYQSYFGGHRIVSASGNPIRTYQPPAWRTRRIYRKGCYVFTGSVLWSVATLRAVGGFNTAFHYCMDFDLYLRIPEQSMNRVTDQPIADFRLQPASKTSTHAGRFAREAYTIRLAHSRGPNDRAQARLSFLTTVLLIATTPIRTTRLYAWIRRDRKNA